MRDLNKLANRREATAAANAAIEAAGLDEGFAELVESTRLPDGPVKLSVVERRRAAEVDRKLESILTPPNQRRGEFAPPCVEEPTPQVITQADIDAEVAKRHAVPAPSGALRDLDPVDLLGMVLQRDPEAWIEAIGRLRRLDKAEKALRAMNAYVAALEE